MDIAYTIKGAAEATAVKEAVIVAAVKAGQLIARRVNNTDQATDTAIILGTDLQAWAESLPNFRATL